MKNLFLLALALVMTCTFAFAQSQTPYSKGKFFGKQLLTLAMEGSEEQFDKLSGDIESYIDKHVETEEDVVNFCEGLEAGVREACKAMGMSDAETDAVIEMVGFSIIEGMLEELSL